MKPQMRTRHDLLQRVRTGPPPQVLIVGGGINGVGLFRDLAAQGVPSLLVEAGDFSCGTSAAPSRLIHGGLRYLETGETALVRESLTERDLLLHNARHVVHPLPVWIPLRDLWGGTLAAVARFLRLKKTPGRKGAVPVKLGLMAYDLFGRATRVMPGHRMIGAAQAHQAMPVLAPDLRAVAEFHDARISHPERLVLELIADAEGDCPEAMALPYLAANGQSGGEITLQDRLDGTTLTVTPRIVVNAAGAWVDRVQGALGIGGRLMGGTRGTHLVLRRPDLSQALNGRMLYFETHDFRACLALPLDDTHVYVGTTDIRTDDPDDTRASDDEIAYIFDVLRPVLPGADLRRDDIVFVMAGIRPLPFQDNQVKATGAISRDHRIDRFDPTPDRPFLTLTLVGGKWTTYRKLAEQAADLVLAELGQTRSTDTATLPIGGALGLPDTAPARSAWVAQQAAAARCDPERFAQLAERYGSGAGAVARAERADPRRFAAITGYTPAEIAGMCRDERVSRLQDVVLRRTLMGFEGQTTEPALAELADLVTEALGWDPARRDAELADTRALLRDRHGVRL